MKNATICESRRGFTGRLSVSSSIATRPSPGSTSGKTGSLSSSIRPKGRNASAVIGSTFTLIVSSIGTLPSATGAPRSIGSKKSFGQRVNPDV
jgi:hypothetical protein